MYMKQYELWSECHNNCTFCFKQDMSGVCPIEQKKRTLLQVLNELDTVYVGKTDNISIGLIGGDFFQGQLHDHEVNELFFRIIKKLYNLGEAGHIHQVILFVTLTLGDHSDLFKAIDMLKPTVDSKLDVWISTSYDTKGRFITKDREENWISNMTKLAGIPKIHLNTTIILTQAFITDVLTGKFDLLGFENKYKTTLFFKQPFVPHTYEKSFTAEENNRLKQEYAKLYPWFLPKRKDMLMLLMKLRDFGMLDRLMGLEYRADELVTAFDSETASWATTRRDKKKNVEGIGEVHNTCGHLPTYMCYIDSDKCVLCDRDTLIDGI